MVCGRHIRRRNEGDKKKGHRACKRSREHTCCSEPDDAFFREWRLKYEDTAYIAEVKEEGQ